MLQDNEGTISTQDQPTGSDIFVSVEMSRSKWVVGIHTPDFLGVTGATMIAVWDNSQRGAPLRLVDLEPPEQPLLVGNGYNTIARPLHNANAGVDPLQHSIVVNRISGQRFLNGRSVPCASDLTNACLDQEWKGREALGIERTAEIEDRLDAVVIGTGAQCPCAANANS
jgi:hypothetical protein